MDQDYLYAFIENAIREDIGDGDHTSLATIPPGKTGKARLLVKETGTLAGVEMAGAVFSRVDPSLNLDFFLGDGARISPGDEVFHVSGSVHSILKSERLVLNIMQRMSGIATTTGKYAAKLSGLKTKVLDTRKTTPGIRFLEKEAVRIGGGGNHRMGLYDMILIKDNHIDFAGGIGPAIRQALKYLELTGKKLFIEIEARGIADVETILATGGIHRIMFDNFTVYNTMQAVKIINGRCETESSGGITLETIRAYGECGVDYISVGALTHHIKSLDLSLKAF